MTFPSFLRFAAVQCLQSCPFFQCSTDIREYHNALLWYNVGIADVVPVRAVMRLIGFILRSRQEDRTAAVNADPAVLLLITNQKEGTVQSPHCTKEDSLMLHIAKQPQPERDFPSSAPKMVYSTQTGKDITLDLLMPQMPEDVRNGIR